MAIKTPKKFTPQEIEQVKKLQSEVNQITMQLGLLQISKLKLEEQEVSIKNQLLTLEKEETKLAQTLTNKYGKGSLDIETGEYTTTK
jgi:hypothetical protein|tara:strand:- start:823 stop:1083 length:261 start_codon:yes stop_codon:yes gene_type:complete